MAYIPYGRQSISDDDIQAVIDVLRSDFLTQGPAVVQFEQAVAQQCQVPYAVAFNSATSALHTACLALDIGPGDCVWTSPITFVASANAVLYCGAQVDFVDIDPHSYNLCMQALEQKLIDTQQAGRPLPKAVIAVHLCGQSCAMQRLAHLAQQYGFKVIEDASHAIGGCYQQQPVGNCAYSDITLFSFHPVKIVTTGEGGVAVTAQADLAQRMALLRSHGITRDPQQMQMHADVQPIATGPWYYEQIALGFNYRMTDIQAALGVSQLQRLSEFVHQRNVLAQQYDHLLANVPVHCPQVAADVYSSFHLYVVRLHSDCVAAHAQVFQWLRSQQIGVNLHYIPVYLQPYYQRLGFKPGYCPVAEQYYASAISLPLYPALTQTQQQFIVQTLSEGIQLCR